VQISGRLTEESSFKLTIFGVEIDVTGFFDRCNLVGFHRRLKEESVSVRISSVHGEHFVCRKRMLVRTHVDFTASCFKGNDWVDRHLERIEVLQALVNAERTKMTNQMFPMRLCAKLGLSKLVRFRSEGS
jgi:hypothetical protein